MAEHGGNKRRTREEESPELETPAVKKIKDDLLSVLDESEPDIKTLDLDLVMKSFEDEIGSSAVDSNECRSELGYLLEASDDELGLPPSVNNFTENTEVSELARADSVEKDGLWVFEEQIPSYASLELGIGDCYNNNNSNDEYVAFDDGLFGYENTCFDYSDYSWRLSTAPAE